MFITFSKKVIFHKFSDSTFFLSKKFKFSKVKKMIFDGVFELAIVDLVDTEYFNFKNN